MSNASVWMAVASIITAAISAFAVIRGQKSVSKAEERNYRNVEVKTIFDGYSQIIEDLRGEVERLQDTIEKLQAEQEECERRNDMLHKEIEELRARLVCLENK